MAIHLWKGGAGSWGDAAQWLPAQGGIPKPGDFVVVSSGTVAINSISLANESVTLSGSSIVAITSTGLSLDAATTLTVANLSNPQIRLDRVTVNAGSIDLESPTLMYVGYFGNNANFTQSGTLQVDSASNFYFQSSQDTLNNTGAINVGASGALSFYDDGSNNTLINAGSIEVDSTQNSMIIASVTGTGSITIGNGASLTLRAVGGGQTLAFATDSGRLVLDGADLTGSLFAAAITGFTAGDTIDLGTKLVSAVTYDPVGQVLTATYNGIQTGTLAIQGNYQASDFSLDNAGTSALLTIGGPNTGAACFAAGTRIDTERGMVAVEDLRPGDRATTALDGTLRPIGWVGHRTLDIRRHARPRDVMPVRIAAHAFGPGQPARDLRLSPDHAVHLDGVLIPIRCLINDATVVQEAAQRITYYHVELDDHDVLLAEGLACESYLDTGNRSAFENGGAAVMAHPDFARAVWESGSCAPLVMTGAPVIAARARLARRREALQMLVDDPGLTLVCDGRVLYPQRRGDTVRFCVPNPGRDVRLRSRAAVAPPGDDASTARRLGVAVRSLYLDGRAVPAGDPRRCAGWHRPEASVQWTDGNARLRMGEVRIVTVKVALGHRYFLEEDAVEPERASA